MSHTTRRADTRWRLPAPESRAVFNERVLCLCAIHGLSETSGMRTRDRNASVGGSEDSKHLLEFGGWARDLAFDPYLGTELTPNERADILRDAQALGLWVVDEGDHLHVQGKALGP